MTDASGAELKPPAGGYGGAPPSLRFGPAAAPENVRGFPRRSLTPFVTAALMLLTLAPILVLVVTGCQRYLAVARTAEVRRELAQMAKDAAIAYEPAHRVCPSASRYVPADPSAISARKYQSQRSEWAADAATNAGFACLHYENPSLQWFQYGYEATPASFTAHGRGDLDGDGVFSEFTWSGHVQGDTLNIARSITERDTEE